MVDEEVLEKIPDKIITLKQIFADSTKEIIALLIVVCFCYLSIHNNSIDSIKDGFNMILGYWVAKASSK